MQRRKGDAAQVAPLGPWFRTRSPEEAIHLCAASFYPHRLALLGPSHSFGMSLVASCASCTREVRPGLA